MAPFHLDVVLVHDKGPSDRPERSSVELAPFPRRTEINEFLRNFPSFSANFPTDLQKLLSSGYALRGDSEHPLYWSRRLFKIQRPPKDKIWTY